MYCSYQSTTPHSSLLCLFPTSSTCSWSLKKKNSQLGWVLNVRCNAISKPTSNDYKELLQDELPLLKKQFEIVEDDVEALSNEVFTSSEIKKYVERIRGNLKCMKDGEINPSPYDTAWIALVKDNDGNPLFPSSLQWIVDNQLPDGSWGDHLLFSAHDRLLSTLASLIALKAWDAYPDKYQKGLIYLKENIIKLEDENMELMPIAFEVAFPALIELAQSYGIEVPQDSPAMQEIHARRNLKLKKIPKEIMHKIPTTLLHSVEGMAGLNWEKLLKLQNIDGSLLHSPAATAYAFMQTKDHKCFTFLNYIVQRFNGGAPNVYPVDLFEHIWVVDRLQRLGISRYFRDELEECVKYVNRHWTEKGISWARNSGVQDIDDTAMGFRIQRLYGYQVSAEVFKNFEKDGEFVCFVGQSSQAVTGMYNVLRASQLQYPGEDILEKTKQFSTKYLRKKQLANQILDKWSITKDLHGEVTYALDIPWYANLPRIETRFYIEQYGGENDAWIGKTLYRMPNVNNNAYLELAKLDYNTTQALHRHEWNNISRWHLDNNLKELGVSLKRLLKAYFLAAAIKFEPEKSNERLAWAKTVALVEAIDFEFTNKEYSSFEERRDFVSEFQHSYISQANVQYSQRKVRSYKRGQKLMVVLLSTLNQLSLDALRTNGTDISNPLFHAWEKWLKKWEEEGDRHAGEAELLVRTIELSAGRWISENVAVDPNTLCLLDITSRLCRHFGQLQSHNNKEVGASINEEGKSDKKIEEEMQKMTELVLSNSINGANSHLKETCLALVKTYFYASHCSPQQIDFHIQNVLFHKVD